VTLEQLLDCDATTLESFTDEQLKTWFEPFFAVTRPSNEQKPSTQGNIVSRVGSPPPRRTVKESLSAREARVMELLNKKFGDKLL
jgi:hypothetical protein